MKRLLLLCTLVIQTSCNLGQTGASRPVEHRPIRPFRPAPPERLSADLNCSGAITRAEWLLCDTPSLRLVHSRLVEQWDIVRSDASPDRLNVIDEQQDALIAERNACRDVPCITAAYYRYLLPPKLPVAAPGPKLWHKPVHRTKPVRHADYHGRSTHDFDDGALSCLADVGLVAAQGLVQQCSEVTPGNYGTCSVKRSCSSLRVRISRGCDETYRKPAFCPRLGEWSPSRREI